MRKFIVIYFLCLALNVFGMEMPPELQARIEEAKMKVKQPSSMFDRPRLDGMFEIRGLIGDVSPFAREMLESMASEGPHCQKKDSACGAMHMPCCKTDPDTQEALHCEYPVGSDVTKKYVAGTCAVDPNPKPLPKFSF